MPLNACCTAISRSGCPEKICDISLRATVTRNYANAWPGSFLRRWPGTPRRGACRMRWKDSEMSLFPIFLKLEGRRCLVVGAGTVAEQKILGLIEAEGNVQVVAPQATDLVREWTDS